MRLEIPSVEQPLTAGPLGNGALAEQMRRANLSIPLHIAEGFGKRSAAEHGHRCYDIAPVSAHECGAVLDASKILGLVDEACFTEGKTPLVRVASTLVKMTQCRAVSDGVVNGNAL